MSTTSTISTPVQASSPSITASSEAGARALSPGAAAVTALEIPTAAGPLKAWWHEPLGTARGVAVVAPGVAVPSRVAAPLADALAARGWRALRMEFHGVGESSIAPADVEGGMAEWGSRDLDAVLRVATQSAGLGPDRLPLVLVGHSAGAWLVSLTPMAAEVDAVLGLASMSGYWRNLKRSAWPQMLPGFFGLISVLTQAFGVLPAWSGLGEEAPGDAMREWAAWCRSERFLFDRPDVATYLDRLGAPVKVLLPDDDEWATEAAVRGVWDRATAADVTIETVRAADHGGRIGHMGLLRKPISAQIWQDAIDWLDEVTAG